MRILLENTIGLVIDIQERLLPVMAERESLIRNSRILINGLQILKIPLIVTQQYTKGLGATVPDIKEILHEFEYIEKRAFSCCDEPAFMEQLKKSGAKNIIICGIESHVCVLQTAVDLRQAGFMPVVVMDCTSSRDLKSKDLAAERFRYEGVMMASCESILFELTRTSESTGFRDISGLVKN
jgi:nicotinamidase-related amidase